MAGSFGVSAPARPADSTVSFRRDDARGPSTAGNVRRLPVQFFDLGRTVDIGVAAAVRLFPRTRTVPAGPRGATPGGRGRRRRSLGAQAARRAGRSPLQTGLPVPAGGEDRGVVFVAGLLFAPAGVDPDAEPVRSVSSSWIRPCWRQGGQGSTVRPQRLHLAPRPGGVEQQVTAGDAVHAHDVDVGSVPGWRGLQACRPRTGSRCRSAEGPSIVARPAGVVRRAMADVDGEDVRKDRCRRAGWA